MTFVVKAALPDEVPGTVRFDEKTMYAGRTIAPGDRIYMFGSENQGGDGLRLRGLVVAVAHGPGIRVQATVLVQAPARRRLGRAELRAYRDCVDDRPETEIARKLYRQATNKIARVTDAAADYLATFF